MSSYLLNVDSFEHGKCSSSYYKLIFKSTSFGMFGVRVARQDTRVLSGPGAVGAVDQGRGKGGGEGGGMGGGKDR